MIALAIQGLFLDLWISSELWETLHWLCRSFPVVHLGAWRFSPVVDQMPSKWKAPGFILSKCSYVYKKESSWKEVHLPMDRCLAERDRPMFLVIFKILALWLSGSSYYRGFMKLLSLGGMESGENKLCVPGATVTDVWLQRRELVFIQTVMVPEWGTPRMICFP